jgi:hypothetical protein
MTHQMTGAVMRQRLLIIVFTSLVVVGGGCSGSDESPSPAPSASSPMLSGAERDWELLRPRTREEYCRSYRAGAIVSVEDLGFSPADVSEHFFEEYMGLLAADC